MLPFAEASEGERVSVVTVISELAGNGLPNTSLLVECCRTHHNGPYIFPKYTKQLELRFRALLTEDDSELESSRAKETTHGAGAVSGRFSATQLMK